MRILINDQIDTQKWNAFLHSSKYASPFHTIEYYDFINTVSNFHAEVFAIDKEEELQTLCVITLQKEPGLKAYFSRRAIIYGGPIIRDHENNTLSLLLQSIHRHLRKKVIYIETRNFHDYYAYRSSFQQLGWDYIPYLNFHLSLKDKTLDDILASMPYNRRREIKLSIKEGVTWDECRSENELDELFIILKELYIERVKLPLPSIEYFRKLYACSISKIFIVKHVNKIIGGAICLLMPLQSIYTMYYCGLRDYHPRIYPAHISVYSAISYAIDHKIQRVDFMGAGKPDQPYGVRKYKEKFGGQLVEYGRFRIITNPFLYRLGKLSLRILSRF